MNTIEWFVILLYIWCITTESWAQFSFRTKDLKIERSAPCPNSQGNIIQMANYSNSHTSRSTILMNTNIHVSRNITGPLTFHMRVKRCNLDLTNCDTYDNFKVADVCDKLQQTNAMWSQYSNNIHPPMHCPILKGSYKLIDGKFDYSLASRLPIDGNRWITYMKLYEDYTDETVQPKTTNRVQVWCLDNDVRITLSKTPVRPTRTGGGPTRKHPPRDGNTTPASKISP